MIRYSKCFNILIDGTVLMKGIWGLTWIPSEASKAARDKYEASVVRQLDMLVIRRTGWAVLKEIFDLGKSRGEEVRIVPFTREDEKEMGEENAFAKPLSRRAAAPRGVTPYKGGTDDPSTPADERYRTLSYTGTGEGSSSEVHFSPEKLPLGPAPLCRRDGTGPGGACRLTPGSDDTPDATLLHELVHSLREMRGQLNQVPTWNKGYDNEEEFFAILVANIYMSEQGKRNLRKDHQSNSKLSEALSTSETFLGKGASPPSPDQLENRRLVHKFVCQNHSLCGHVSGIVNAAFNPIREFMRNSQLYPLYPR